MKWELINEFKNIDGFECQKATTTFRGRNYSVWFTNSIPVPFGPWKLRGLSGLILEAYDSEKFIHIKAKKITFGSNYNLNTDYNKLDLSTAMSIEDLLKKIKQLRVDFLIKLNSKLPKGMKPIKIDTNCTDCRKELEIFNEPKK